MARIKMMVSQSMERSSEEWGECQLVELIEKVKTKKIPKNGRLCLNFCMENGKNWALIKITSNLNLSCRARFISPLLQPYLSNLFLLRSLGRGTRN